MKKLITLAFVASFSMFAQAQGDISQADTQLSSATSGTTTNFICNRTWWDEPCKVK